MYLRECIPSLCVDTPSLYKLVCCFSGMDVILKIFQMIESNYPEDLKTAYVLNGTYMYLHVHLYVCSMLRLI